MKEPLPYHKEDTTQASVPQTTKLLLPWKDLSNLQKSLIVREGLAAPTPNQQEAAARLLDLLKAAPEGEPDPNQDRTGSKSGREGS